MTIRKREIGLILFFLISKGKVFAQNNEYKKQSAKNKSNTLWNKIVATEYKDLPRLDSKGWNSIIRSLQSILNLRQTFDNKIDFLETDKKKIIHSYGVVSQVSWISNKDHTYSGILATGGEGLARFSLAANPEKTKSFIPGMALKILIDKHPSMNIMAMNSLSGQGKNHNWFYHDFMTKIDPPQSWALKIASFIFSLVKSPPNILSINHLCSIGNSGKKVERIHCPDSLIFKPTKEIRNIIYSKSKNDFRKDLSILKEKIIMYDIFAAKDDGSIPQKIGIIRKKTRFISSSFGDFRLFFQHHR